MPNQEPDRRVCFALQPKTYTRERGEALKFKEAASRLTGFSVPLFGVQWNPPEAECVAARRVLAFLEDRRVLYVPSEMEAPDHCMQSVIMIREFLTAELGKLQPGDALASILIPIRSACRKFLSTVEADERRAIRFGAHQGHFASWIFNGAVGELRGVVGLHVARLAGIPSWPHSRKSPPASWAWIVARC